MTYLLNSPVLTSYGEWVFEGPVGVERAREVIRDGFVSAIGHQATVEFLRNLLGMEVPLNRVRVQMKPGDRALVVRVLDRIPEGKVLSADEMGRIPYELGVLTRLA